MDDMRGAEKISDAMAMTLADEFGVLAEVLKALARRRGGP
jgi:plasmid maintenance system antidote protein VapI